jgi:hypothetical protein
MRWYQVPQTVGNAQNRFHPDFGISIGFEVSSYCKLKHQPTVHLSNCALSRIYTSTSSSGVCCSYVRCTFFFVIVLPGPGFQRTLCAFLRIASQTVTSRGHPWLVLCRSMNT